jgi:hypothetical protein
MEILKKLKRNESITPNLKRQVWENYCGIHVTETHCALCETNKIYLNKNSGFECAHIIADKYLNRKLSVLYLYPSCAACNNECRDLCLLDYLWVRGRFKQLRKMIMDIYRAYLGMHDLSRHEKMAWKVIEHLYGKNSFHVGGGIVNEIQIYEQARLAEGGELRRKMNEKLEELGELQENWRKLMEEEIKVKVFF